MIYGYRALRRQLQQFIGSLGIPWDDVNYNPDRDEEGRVLRDDECLEVSFRMPSGRLVEMAIFAPSTDRDHKPDGKNVLPLGKVAARIDGQKVAGPIDQETWANIKKVINE